MSAHVVPLSLKDAPALIERLLPVQKLSAEAFKEQMANQGKALTALGSYWKGRKPLILAKACILGALLPASDDPEHDLEIFEKLMALDDESFVVRWKRRATPKEILQSLTISRITDYFTASPEGALPTSSPIDWSRPEYENVKVDFRDDLSETDRLRLEVQMLPRVPYKARVEEARRPEEVIESVYDHIWGAVNSHLGTSAYSLPELIEQLGVMRFGRRPRVGDTFCGSGQIPFEAARLGCDVYASDLNPVACMLTWGALNIVGAPRSARAKLSNDQNHLMLRVQEEIDRLGVEEDANGWHAKTFLYCVEVRCPQSGWLVPLLPTRVISKTRRAVARLIPDYARSRYEVEICSGVTPEEMAEANGGTIVREGRFSDAYLLHHIKGQPYKTKISTLRGDYKEPDGTVGNRIRRWEKSDFRPRTEDIFQERVYAIHWARATGRGKKLEYEFRAITSEDLSREKIVEAFIEQHLAEWQEYGWVPDLRIEPGGPPRYEGLNLVRGRG